MKKIVLISIVILGIGSLLNAQTKHTVGEKFGGGIVFEVKKNGLHGLIAETIDQSGNCKLENIQAAIADPQNHSIEGKAFSDWRLPTKAELMKLSENKVIIDGFAEGLYLGSIPNDATKAFTMSFGSFTLSGDGLVGYHIRAVREF